MWNLLGGLLLLVPPQQGPALPVPPRGYSPSAAEVVVDDARVLSPNAIGRVNRIAFDVKAKSGGEMVFVTMPDLGGRDVGDVALRIGREWGLGAVADAGDRTKNAAVVVLIVPKETSSDGRGYISIQTARGVEGFLTDAIAGDMRREAIPYLQAQDYSGAMELLAQRVAERFAGEFGFSLDTSLEPVRSAEMPRGRESSGVPFQAVLFFLVMAFFVLSALAQARRGGRRGCSGCLYVLLAANNASRGRGGWGGGGFGGGSFGGGGGGFGGFGGGGGFSGGGSSGSW